MPTVRFIGDVHGKFGRYSTILDNSPFATIQIGDMGVGFSNNGVPSANPPYDKMVRGEHKFIRGNHDNPWVCARHTQCIPDGMVLGNMMFCGGAFSIDKHYRTIGDSWWEDEELSFEELQRVIDDYEHAKPELMVSHETPESIAEMIVGNLRNLATPGQTFKLKPENQSRTRTAFQRMFDLHKPKLWLFGHWHVPFDVTVDGTRFMCLPELGLLDVDTDKAEPIAELITQRDRW